MKSLRMIEFKGGTSLKKKRCHLCVKISEIPWYDCV